MDGPPEDGPGATAVQRPPLDDEVAVREWLTRRRIEFGEQLLRQRHNSNNTTAPAPTSTPARSSRRRHSNTPDPAPPAPSEPSNTNANAPLPPEPHDGLLSLFAFLGWLAIWLGMSASLVLPVLVVLKRGFPSLFLLSCSVLVVATAIRVLLACAFLTRPGGQPGGRRRQRHFHIPHGVSAERAAYMRAAHRLAYVDRDFSPADYEALLELDHNNQRLKRFLEGASQGTIDSLPSYNYTGRTIEQAKKCDWDNDITAPEHRETATACSICLEHFSNGQLIRILPCFHQFHVDCVDRWLLQQGRCPVCKASIVQENIMFSEAC